MVGFSSPDKHHVFTIWYRHFSYLARNTHNTRAEGDGRNRAIYSMEGTVSLVKAVFQCDVV